MLRHGYTVDGPRHELPAAVGVVVFDLEEDHFEVCGGRILRHEDCKIFGGQVCVWERLSIIELISM